MPGRSAEIHWPSIAGSPYAGQVWAVEVELTPKPLARTVRIMGGLLNPLRYAQVIYLTAPPAALVAARAAAALRAEDQARITVRELPVFTHRWPPSGRLCLTADTTAADAQVARPVYRLGAT